MIFVLLNILFCLICVVKAIPSALQFPMETQSICNSKYIEIGNRLLLSTYMVSYLSKTLLKHILFFSFCFFVFIIFYY